MTSGVLCVCEAKKLARFDSSFIFALIKRNLLLGTVTLIKVRHFYCMDGGRGFITFLTDINIKSSLLHNDETVFKNRIMF